MKNENENKSLIQEFQRVLELEGRSLLQCAARLQCASQAEHISKAITLFQQSLERGGKIIVTGVGKSGLIAKKIAATLSSTGSLAQFLHPTEGLHGDLGIVSPLDSVLALSHTGNTDELVRLLPSFKSLGVPVVGLGGNLKSQLASLCDAWVDGFVEQEACPHNLAPTASTTLALALGDAIALTLMQRRGFDPARFAKNHPGGALGRRLSLTVEALMHRGESVPVLPPNASMDEVVVVNTEKKLGAVLIVENGKLAGIITDGDLRRALKHRERFFALKAADIMTRNPATAAPGMMALEAMALMENRPSQITVLPVINENNEAIGILHLHDLLRNL